MTIRDATVKDAAAIADIYNYYILNSTATFEETAVTTETMAERMNSVIPDYPWYIFDDGQILGYIYIAKYKSRCAYRKTAELTVYIRNGQHGQGIGSSLFSHLFSPGHRWPVHSIVAGIALPNEASIRLHEKFGFEKVAHFKQIGYKFGEWIDVEYWQKIIE